MSDVSVGLILDAIDDAGAAGDTVVIFTSDHGDQCGSHALRSKGPWNYEETMHIPLYVTAPGITTPGTRSEALTSHVDLTVTVAELAGVDLSGAGLPGHNLVPLLADPAGGGREEVLFAQDWAWYDGLLDTRYASRGIFDGRFKYCRYYGIGGSSTTSARPPAGPKLFDIDADFDDQEHELYDLAGGPARTREPGRRPGTAHGGAGVVRAAAGGGGGGLRGCARKPPRRRPTLGGGLARPRRARRRRAGRRPGDAFHFGGPNVIMEA